MVESPYVIAVSVYVKSARVLTEWSLRRAASPLFRLFSRQQSIPTVTFQLGMGEYPLRVRPPAALAFLGLEPPESAVFTDREFRLGDRPSEFRRCVPLPHLLALNQHDE